MWAVNVNSTTDRLKIDRLCGCKSHPAYYFFFLLQYVEVCMYSPRLERQEKMIQEGHPICNRFGEFLSDWTITL